MMRGSTAPAQLLVAGEHAIGIAQSGKTMLAYKARDAPVDMSILDPWGDSQWRTCMPRPLKPVKAIVASA